MRLRQLVRVLRNTVTEYSQGNRALAVACGYAVVVSGVTVFVIVANTVKPASIAGIWLILATLPSSLVLQFLPAQGVAFALLLTLGGFAQAWLLWVILRGKRVLQRH